MLIEDRAPGAQGHLGHSGTLGMRAVCCSGLNTDILSNLYTGTPDHYNECKSFALILVDCHQETDASLAACTDYSSYWL